MKKRKIAAIILIALAFVSLVVFIVLACTIGFGHYWAELMLGMTFIFAVIFLFFFFIYKGTNDE